MKHVLDNYLFLQKLKALPYVKAIYLYGSRARGDASPHSDIDLAIVCPQATVRDWQSIIDIIEDADTLLKIDCIRYDTLSATNPLKQSIDQEKVILMEQLLSPRTILAFKTLGKALTALEIMAQKPTDPDRGVIDATIQRFEFSIELFWKALKKLMLDLGKETQFPKDVLREAYANKLIDNETVWLNMLADRNETSHAYDEELADKIYAHIKNHYVSAMRDAYDNLIEKYHLKF